MKKIIFTFASISFVSCITFANSEVSEYFRRCESSSTISPDNINFCREALKKNMNEIIKAQEDEANAAGKLERASTDNPKITKADAEKVGQIQTRAQRIAVRLEKAERTQTTLNLDEEIKQTDSEIQSLERYLNQLDQMTPEADKKKPAFKGNWELHQTNLKELKEKSARLWQERTTRASTLGASTIVGTPDANPSSGLFETVSQAEVSPQSSTEPSQIVGTQTRSATPAPAQAKAAPLDQLQREVSQREVDSIKRQIAYRDVENRFDSLRLQNAGLQVRLQALQKKYDNALLGHYVKAKFGKLLQANVFCEKADKCASNSTTDIQNLDTKVKTQIFTENK